MKELLSIFLDAKYDVFACLSGIFIAIRLKTCLPKDKLAIYRVHTIPEFQACSDRTGANSKIISQGIMPKINSFKKHKEDTIYVNFNKM